MSSATGVLDRDDLVEDLGVTPGEERSAVDHHVDLVSAHCNRGANLVELDPERTLPRGERRRDRGHLDAAPGQPCDRRGDEVGVHVHTAATEGTRRDRTDRAGVAFEQRAATLPGVS